MRFLADESCDFRIVRALRDAGHDVDLVRDRAPGAKDDTIAFMARDERRVLLTEDKDFGRLARAMTGAALSVILLRFPAPARAEIARATLDTVAALGPRLEGAFVVVEPGRYRVTEGKP